MKKVNFLADHMNHYSFFLIIELKNRGFNNKTYYILYITKSFFRFIELEKTKVFFFKKFSLSMFKKCILYHFREILSVLNLHVKIGNYKQTDMHLTLNLYIFASLLSNTHINA